MKKYSHTTKQNNKRGIEEKKNMRHRKQNVNGKQKSNYLNKNTKCERTKQFRQKVKVVRLD